MLLHTTLCRVAEPKLFDSAPAPAPAPTIKKFPLGLRLPLRSRLRLQLRLRLRNPDIMSKSRNRTGEDVGSFYCKSRTYLRFILCFNKTPEWCDKTLKGSVS